MTPRSLIELALAAAIFIAGVWLYRRRSDGPDAPDGGYGSQGAVLLIVVAALIAVHGLGLMNARPTAAEMEAMRQ